MQIDAWKIFMGYYSSLYRLTTICLSWYWNEDCL